MLNAAVESFLLRLFRMGLFGGDAKQASEWVAPLYDRGIDVPTVVRSTVRVEHQPWLAQSAQAQHTASNFKGLKNRYGSECNEAGRIFRNRVDLFTGNFIATWPVAIPRRPSTPKL